MDWEHPIYFYGLLALAFCWGLAFLSLYSRKKRLQSFCHPAQQAQLVPEWSLRRRGIKIVLWGIVLTGLILSLANPRWGESSEKLVRKGTDIMLVVDVSNSMLAEDFKPSRLERARREIIDFLKQANGDRIGMIIFAGKSIAVCPLTLDYQALDPFIMTLSTDLVPIQGSDLGGALQQAIANFRDEKTSKKILLLTDGEDQEGNTEEVLTKLKEQKIPLYILGFGTPEGAPIPLPLGGGGFKRDDQGNVIMTRLNEEGLKKLANDSGGKYVRSVSGDEDLEALYEQGLHNDLQNSSFQSGTKTIKESRFQWALGAALVFLLIETLVSEVKRLQK